MIVTWAVGIAHVASVKDASSCRLARKQYWLVAMLLVGPLAAVLYLLVGRPKPEQVG